jgi:alpha-tubulin suppressor-like RCC1 family protein
MNVTNLVLQLQSKLSTDTLDQQMISKAIKLLKLGAVKSVAIFSSLPAANENAGELYYVDYDGLYWSTGEFWFPIAQTNYFSAWAWGNNGYGRLGFNTNTITDGSFPNCVVGGFTDWCQVSAGGLFSVGLRQNGTIWAWGRNSNGQLGFGGTGDRFSPELVAGDITDWCYIGPGCIHSAAIRRDGTAWTWGNNFYGRLGDGTEVNSSSPVSVIGGFTDWCQISAGSFHTVGVRQNGTAWSWGRNANGQLGTGDTIDSSSPVSIIGDFTDWCQVSAGNTHALGLRSNGTIYAWGFSGEGRLGQNNLINRSSPVLVIGGFTDWCQVSVSVQHSSGVKFDGTLWTWGNNGSGRLGDGTTANRSSPVQVLGGFTDWCQVNAGGVHGVGLRQNGTIWAWGANNCHQLGDGTTEDKSSPISVGGGFTDWSQVSSGVCHNLAIRNVQL